jgi:endonuclease/exonuclease/phosphatase family metal-dependent hydrolase
MVRAVRIASYNIHRCIGADGQHNPQRVARVLQMLNADIIALQEVGFETDKEHNVLQYLGKSIDAQIIEGVTLLDERGQYGNAVLSRLPIDTIKLHDISVSQCEPRGVIELQLNLNGHWLQLLATHLGLRHAERRSQVDYLLELLSHSQADIQILMGDLNQWWCGSASRRRLQNYFSSVKNKPRQCPAPRTFPARWPLFSLDRILIQPARLCDRLELGYKALLNQKMTSQNTTNTDLSVRQLARCASDHLPLLAELTLPDQHQPGKP